MCLHEVEQARTLPRADGRPEHPRSGSCGKDMLYFLAKALGLQSGLEQSPETKTKAMCCIPLFHG